MTLIADILLAAGALGAAFYCFILGRRLRKFNNLETGMGGAVAVLSAQVDDLEKTLTAAQSTAQKSAQDLEALAARAEDVRRQLEIQIASIHDIVPQPGPSEVSPPATPKVEKTESKPENIENVDETQLDEAVAEPLEDTSPAIPALAEQSEPMFMRRRVKEA